MVAGCIVGGFADLVVTIWVVLRVDVNEKSREKDALFALELIRLNCGGGLNGVHVVGVEYLFFCPGSLGLVGGPGGSCCLAYGTCNVSPTYAKRQVDKCFCVIELRRV